MGLIRETRSELICVNRLQRCSDVNIRIHENVRIFKMLVGTK